MRYSVNQKHAAGLLIFTVLKPSSVVLVQFGLQRSHMWHLTVWVAYQEVDLLNPM